MEEVTLAKSVGHKRVPVTVSVKGEVPPKLEPSPPIPNHMKEAYDAWEAFLEVLHKADPGCWVEILTREPLDWLNLVEEVNEKYRKEKERG